MGRFGWKMVCRLKAGSPLLTCWKKLWVFIDKKIAMETRKIIALVLAFLLVSAVVAALLYWLADMSLSSALWIGFSAGVGGLAGDYVRARMKKKNEAGQA